MVGMRESIVPLELPTASRFPQQPEPLPDEFVAESHTLLLKISRSPVQLQELDRQDILERFKKHFSRAIGMSHYNSSNTYFAEFDLKERMKEAKTNAPLFLEALYDSIEASRVHGGYHAPDTEYLNDLCRRHSVPYVIEPPSLLRIVAGHGVVPQPTPPKSLAENAGATLNRSMDRAAELLAAGRAREAVQEMLWMLESLSTAFRGVPLPMGEVRGAYFNQIARELKTAAAGTALSRVIEWIGNLHGYLSSPTGGGVRHGRDLTSGTELSISEGRLFVNLMLSYTAFLLSEHERLLGTNAG
jgi:hypothetical protein